MSLPIDAVVSNAPAPALPPVPMEGTRPERGGEEEVWNGALLACNVFGEMPQTSRARNSLQITDRRGITSSSSRNAAAPASLLPMVIGDREGCTPYQPRATRMSKVQNHSKGFWPWNGKYGWKGPLPKPSFSPSRTLGDILVPKLIEAQDLRSSSFPARSQSQDCRTDLDQRQIQISKLSPVGLSPGPSNTVGQTTLAWSRRYPGLASLQRRLTRKPNTCDCRTYAEVVMAGSAAMGGPGGAGDGDQRRSRNYSGQLHFTRGGGRPPRPYGRGRGRDRVQSGRGYGDNAICRPHGRDASGQGEGGHNAHQTGNVTLAAGKERGDNSQTHAMKHKGTQFANEPVSKKKKKFVLCCEICEEEHFTSQCPLLHGPKPTATFCGLAGEGLGFFYIPYTSAAKAPRRVSATALITIVEGNVQADLVKKELAQAIPVKWDWVVREHGDNTYIVPFPCQVELQRMISMKRLRIDNNEGVMLFEEWNNEIKPKQRLQNVWVNVYGVPYEIRSFLPLWAVGSILGATQRVDMRSMKKTGVVRLLVAVLDVHSIPDDADIVVDDCLYEIFFKVEQVVTDNNEDLDELDEDDDLHPKESNHDKDQEMEDAEKGKQNDSGSTSSTNFNTSVLPNTSNQLQKEGAPTAQELEIIDKAIDSAVDSLLEEASVMVMSEPLEDSVPQMAHTHSSLLNGLVLPDTDFQKSLMVAGDSIGEGEALLGLASEPMVGLECESPMGNDLPGSLNEANPNLIKVDALESEPPLVQLAKNQFDSDDVVETSQLRQKAISFEATTDDILPIGSLEQHVTLLHTLPRRQLQMLAKENGIRANLSSLAMVTALRCLSNVVGLEDLKLALAKENEVDRRSSKRVASKGDDKMMEKAMNLVVKKNSMQPGYLQGNILAAVLGIVAA